MFSWGGGVLQASSSLTFGQAPQHFVILPPSTPQANTSARNGGGHRFFGQASWAAHDLDPSPEAPALTVRGRQSLAGGRPSAGRVLVSVSITVETHRLDVEPRNSAASSGSTMLRT